LYPLENILVGFPPNVSEGAIQDFAVEFDVQLVATPDLEAGRLFHVFRRRTPNPDDLFELIARMDRSPLTKWADFNGWTEVRLFGGGEPYFGYQYYLRNTRVRNGIRADINVEPAWSRTKGGSIRVAVLDDGIDISNEDLSVSTLGWDVVKLHHPQECPSSTPISPYRYDNHGTAVAGILAGAHNGLGIAGVAPDVDLIPIRVVCRTHPQTADGLLPQWIEKEVWPTVFVEAVNFWGADVISASLGDLPAHAALTEAIEYAATAGRGGRGSILVFAAGNCPETQPNCSPAYPASLANSLPVLSVAALTKGGERASYSPRTATWTPNGITLSAFGGEVQWGVGYCGGGDIISTDRPGTVGCSFGPAGNNDYWLGFGGTSAATPQVAGAAALMLSLEPHLTASQVKNRLTATADPWGIQTEFGAGKLNIARAVPGFQTEIIGPSLVEPNTWVTWSAGTIGGPRPYQHQWYYEGGILPIHEGDTYTKYIGDLPGMSSFSLRLDATDASNATTSASLNVTVATW
jgi:serine protease